MEQSKTAANTSKRSAGQQRGKDAGKQRRTGHASKSANESTSKRTSERTRAPRYYLEPGDEIEKAPSIGKKTAARLMKIGIETVDDLLKADPRDISSAVNVKWISAQEVENWQKQARLVCEIADLRGGHAQILVGAGIVSSRSLALLSGNELLSMMKLYCHGEGKNLRACERLPELARVEGWIKSVIEHPKSVAA
jgi:predicted flap endonuclease-1-like 5' DNA nuclease